MELRVERGAPTAEELAAIVTVLMLRTGAPPAAPAPMSRWALSARPAYAHRDGRPTSVGRDAWRASALPR